jgi:hypothetical protein
MRDRSVVAAVLFTMSLVGRPALQAQPPTPASPAGAPSALPLIQLTGTYFYCSTPDTHLGCHHKRFVSSDLWVFSDQSAASRVGYRTIPLNFTPGRPSTTVREHYSRISDASFAQLVATAADAAIDTALGKCNPVRSHPLGAEPSQVSYTLVYWGTETPHSVSLGSLYQEQCPPALEALFWRVLDLTSSIARTPQIVEPL